MEVSPVQRFAAFVVVVLVLAGLGVYLFLPHRSAAGGRHDGAHRRCANSASARHCASTAPTPQPGNPAPSGQAAPDIYQWLPFTQSGLAAAAAVVTRFGDAYGTYSYTRSASAYAASLQPAASPSLIGQIEAAYAAPGVAATRANSKQVAVGVATIEAISGFGPTSLTFLLQIAEQITATTGTSQTSTRYSVTVTGNGTSWQVTGVELATVGNS
jgi:hypothetical protein